MLLQPARSVRTQLILSAQIMGVLELNSYAKKGFVFILFALYINSTFFISKPQQS